MRPSVHRASWIALLLLPSTVAAQQAGVFAPAPVPPAAPDERPALFQASDLLYAGAFFGTLAALRPLQGLDEGLRPDEPPSGVAKAWVDAADVAGNALVLYGGSAATWATGELLDAPGVARVGLRSLESLAVAGVLTYGTKLVVGRRRPREDGVGSTEFDPFTGNEEWQSFPSGHAAHAFAVASAISIELGDDAPWVPWVAYPVAGLIGASRVVGRDHWLTDVVAGSAVGLFAGHFVSRWYRRETTSDAAPPVSFGLPGAGPVLLVHLSVN